MFNELFESDVFFYGVGFCMAVILFCEIIALLESFVLWFMERRNMYKIHKDLKRYLEVRNNNINCCEESKEEYNARSFVIFSLMDYFGYELKPDGTIGKKDSLFKKFMRIVKKKFGK